MYIFLNSIDSYSDQLWLKLLVLRCILRIKNLKYVYLPNSHDIYHEKKNCYEILIFHHEIFFCHF